MKALSIIACFLAMLFSLPLNADARIELDTDTCHFPRSNTDTDDEDKVTCVGVLIENANGGAVAGRSKVIQWDIPEDFIPPTTTTSGRASNTNCVLRNDDGTEAQVADWLVTIEGMCTLMKETFTTLGPIYTPVPASYSRRTDSWLERQGVRRVCNSTREISCGTGDDAQIN